MMTEASLDKPGSGKCLAPFALTEQDERLLLAGWERARVAAGTCTSPAGLGNLAWRPAEVPGTVTTTPPSPESADDLSHDHWYRCRFAAATVSAVAQPSGVTEIAVASPISRWLLCFDGLATLAEVWLNGQLLLTSDNMFRSYVCDVSTLLIDENVLVLRFSSLGHWLKQRRPRGRWPTRLVSEKNLRHVRTSLLGFMPGWYPPLPLIGPWQPVRLLAQRRWSVEDVQLSTDYADQRGRIELCVVGRAARGAADAIATLELEGLGDFPLSQRERADGALEFFGSVEVEAVEPWWPHTHGTPRLYSARVALRLGDAECHLELGRVGFRRIQRVATESAGFALHVNGVPVFCRGACLAPLDVARGHAAEETYRQALELARDGGMNMLRVGGTMLYESAHFYRLCDELGLLVWQDFMFANMDYPVAEPAFAANCRAEATDFLRRVATRASLAVLCGNSEVQQQAAMMGVEREAWSNAWFDEILPEICATRRPDVHYVSSSPSGGDLPFHVDAGPGHYYGVGAYLRPLADVYAANVQFTSECLGFSQVPDESSLQNLMGEAGLAMQHPRYRAGVPRDNGAAWDFADVTDHYVEVLFGSEVRALRYADAERYLALCRVATGRVMESVVGVWRRRADACAGALVWLYRDVQPGAGWGVVEASGRPKAAYYHLRRIFAPVALWFVDAGVNGLSIHLANDTQATLSGSLSVCVCRADGVVADRAELAFRVEAHSEATTSVDRVLGRVTDANYAYRFGPLEHAVVIAQFDADASSVGPGTPAWRACHLVRRAVLPELCEDLGVTALAEPAAAGSYRVRVRSARFAESVAVDAPGYLPSDNYFHVPAGETHSFFLRPERGSPPLRGKIRPLNAARASAIQSAEQSVSNGGSS